MDPEEIRHANEQFETSDPAEILRWAADRFAGEWTVVTSFQPTGIVTLHLLSDIAPRTPILTLDTGLLFPETYALIRELEARFELNLIRIHPVQTVEEQHAVHGPNLWEQNPDLCCLLRKVAPLDDALAPYRAWVTGLRRDQSARRASTPIVAWDSKHQKIKLCPFATWTEEETWSYIHSHNLPYNPLHDQNYPSIGCLPCTQPVESETLDKRVGRWANRSKTECGIHIGNL